MSRISYVCTRAALDNHVGAFRCVGNRERQDPKRAAGVRWTQRAAISADPDTQTLTSAMTPAADLQRSRRWLTYATLRKRTSPRAEHGRFLAKPTFYGSAEGL